MEVIQVLFEVPSLIQEGINNGTLRIFGGVVRNLKGEIVYHLKDVVKVIEKANVKTKLIFAGIGIGTIVVVAGAYAVNKIIKKKNAFPNAINQFNQKLFEYILAAKNMVLNTEIISNLDESVELLKDAFRNSNKDLKLEGTIDLQKFNELIDSVYRYTLELVEKNMGEEQVVERSNQVEIESNIIDLQNYLRIQRKVFERCS